MSEEMSAERFAQLKRSCAVGAFTDRERVWAGRLSEALDEVERLSAEVAAPDPVLLALRELAVVVRSWSLSDLDDSERLVEVVDALDALEAAQLEYEAAS